MNIIVKKLDGTLINVDIPVPQTNLSNKRAIYNSLELTEDQAYFDLFLIDTIDENKEEEKGDENILIQGRIYMIYIHPLSEIIETILQDFRNANIKTIITNPLNPQYDPDSCETQLEWFQREAVNTILDSFANSSFKKYKEMYGWLYNNHISRNFPNFHIIWRTFSEKVWNYLMNSYFDNTECTNLQISFFNDFKTFCMELFE